MAEILGEHIDKKHALYIGGALASIVALIWFMKSRATSSAAAQPLSAPSATPGTVTGGTSDALAATQLNAATQLQIATGNQAIQREQIAAQTSVARGAQSTQLGAAALGAAVTPGGQSTLKELFDLVGKGVSAVGSGIGSLFSAIFGKGTSSEAAPGSLNDIAFKAEGAYVSPSTFSFTGAPATALESGGMVDWAGEQTMSAPGTTGMGSTEWFGNAPMTATEEPTWPISFTEPTPAPTYTPVIEPGGFD
jgi:hypothetical protein